MGAGQYLAYVAPRERLRILGAHESVFAPQPPAALKPALDAYYKRDYAGSEKAVRNALDRVDLYGLDLKKARQLLDAAVLMQKSIAMDLAKMKILIDDDKPYEASEYMDGLKAVIPEGHAEFAALAQLLRDPALKTALDADKQRLIAYRKALPLRGVEVTTEREEEDAVWLPLVRARGKDVDNPTVWRMLTLEAQSLAPDGWTEPDFDDSGWDQTTMPTAWIDNHSAMIRTQFDIADPDNIAFLRLSQYAYNQQAIRVYINGAMVAKMTESGGGGRVNFKLNDYAVKCLRKGKNTLAVTYKHNWRWGRYFRGKDSIYNGGVNLTLEMQEKE